MKIYSNLVLVEVIEYMTESQFERQCPHRDWSIALISIKNWFVCHGSQVDIIESLALGRYQGTHWVTLEARTM